jgi:hypothetical protein
MQIKVTIELVGDQSLVVPALAKLAETLSAEIVLNGESDASWWSDEQARAIVGELKLPALVALKAIAEGAPKTPAAVVQRELKRKGFRMTPGALSSIGFAARRLGSPAPFVRDNYQGVYTINPAVASVLQPAIRDELDKRQMGA